MLQAIAHILTAFTEPIDVEQLVRMSGRRRTFFYRKFKAITGLTPNLFVQRLRMQVACYLLGRTDKSVTDIAFESGYASISYFINHFKQYSGLSPRDYRKSLRTGSPSAPPQ